MAHAVEPLPELVLVVERAVHGGDVVLDSIGARLLVSGKLRAEATEVLLAHLRAARVDVRGVLVGRLARVLGEPHKLVCGAAPADTDAVQRPDVVGVVAHALPQRLGKLVGAEVELVPGRARAGEHLLEVCVVVLLEGVQRASRHDRRELVEVADDEQRD